MAGAHGREDRSQAAGRHDNKFDFELQYHVLVGQEVEPEDPLCRWKGGAQGLWEPVNHSKQQV